MKLFLLLMLSNICVAQTTIPKNADGLYEYTDVVNTDSINAEALYSKAKLFIVTAFKSGKDVTQLNDDNARTVAGSGSMQLHFKGFISSQYNYWVRFKFIVQCKDGRYKYTVNSFELHQLPMNVTIALENDKVLKRHVTQKIKEQIFDQVNTRITGMIAELKEEMTKNENW